MADDLIEAFASEYPFALDPFQREAISHLAAGRSVLVAAPTGTGKALEATTPVLTPTGWKAIGDLRIGDLVIGANGQPVKVTGSYPQGKRPAYRVTFTDRVSVVCDLDHLWAVNTKSRQHDKLPWRVLTLRQILAEGLTDGLGRRHFIPLVKPVEFPKSEPADEERLVAAVRQRAGLTQRALSRRLGVSQGYVAHRETGRRTATAEYQRAVAEAVATIPQRHLHPYLLGLLLGDGGFSTSALHFTSADHELIESVRTLLPEGATLRKVMGSPYDWYILSSQPGTRNPAVAELRSLGLMGHRAEGKFIPHVYKFAPATERLALLQGLLDSDGSVGISGADLEYTTVSATLAEDVAFLVRSLGGRTRIRQKSTGFQKAYRQNIILPAGITPFALQRKAERYQARLRHNPCRAIAAIEPQGEAEMVCISVDAPDGLYVIDGFVVTHNTVVAEYGIWMAHNQGKRVIYTAPLKALSNQKFRDLRARYGPQMVGLVTGDIVERNQAPILVMTTEIYRNMLLEEEARDEYGARSDHSSGSEDTTPSDPADTFNEGARAEAAAGTPEQQPFIARLNPELNDVGCVIFDELHYLSDPERGPVWEEAIIHSPKHVPLIGLSATVSNADELAIWISRVHRPISLVLHTERAIPLDHYYYLDGRLHLVMNAEGRRVERFPKIGGEAKRRRERGEARVYTFGGESKGQSRSPATDGASARPGSAAPGQPAATAGRPNADREAPEPGEILAALRQADLLPCLYFLPGRRIVEESASSAAGHLLTTPEEQTLLREEVNAWLEVLPAEDRELEQVQRLTALLPRGLAYHHAGLLPGLKVLVETLFQRGRLRAVFATDTLALGINMPARSVVVGSLSKFDGVGMRLLTPNEYQQLTGRAGRRGMDERGAAIIPYSPWEPFEQSFAALTGALLPVNSAFSMRYNSVLNLWRGGDIRRLRRDVAASFREFQRYSHRLLYEERLANQELPPLAAEDQALIEALAAEDASRGRRARRERKKAPPERERYRALSRAGAAELNGIISVLRSLSYIDPHDRLTIKGRLLRSIFHPAGILFTEMIQAIPLERLHASELAELASWFAFDDDRPVRNRSTLWRHLALLRREVYRVIGSVQMNEIDLGLDVSPGINDAFHGVALHWWRGASLASLQRHIDLAEGDLLVILNQTIDLLQQVQGAVGQVLDEKRLWQTGDTQNEADRIRAVQIQAARQSLEELRPRLGAAARGLIRGIVLQSRTVPSMAVQVADESVPLDMEEDEDKRDLRADIPEEYP
ncbi:MAG TPA: DEAD/DEAH box helicase [Ktedonobacterales bacterium]